MRLRVLNDLGADPMSYKTIQWNLTQVIAVGYRDRIAQQRFE